MLNSEELNALAIQAVCADDRSRARALRHARRMYVGFLIALNLIFFWIFYYLLTSSNPFVFNNNFHLIGFASCFFSVVNVSLLVLYWRERELEKSILYRLQQWYEVHAPQACSGHDDVPQAGLSAWVMAFLFSCLTICPLFLYLVLDEFSLKSGHAWLTLLAILIFLGLHAHAVKLFFQNRRWQEWRQWDWKTIAIKVLFLGAGLLLLWGMVYFLTGIIPAEVQSQPSQSLFAL